MRDCEDIVKYMRGETIPIRIIGDNDTDLDANSWKFTLINPFGAGLELSKSMFTKLSDNDYEYIISNTYTKTMKEGQYKAEFFLGDSETMIFSENIFFEIKDSYSKKYVL